MIRDAESQVSASNAVDLPVSGTPPIRSRGGFLEFARTVGRESTAANNRPTTE